MCWFLIQNGLDKNLHPIKRLHEITLELARSYGLPQLLSDLQNRAVREELKRDTVSGLKARNIQVPARATAEFRQLGADNWEIEVKVVEKKFAYINGFNNKTGFFTRIQGPKMRPRAGG